MDAKENRRNKKKCMIDLKNKLYSVIHLRVLNHQLKADIFKDIDSIEELNEKEEKD